MSQDEKARRREKAKIVRRVQERGSERERERERERELRKRTRVSHLARWLSVIPNCKVFLLKRGRRKGWRASSLPS